MKKIKVILLTVFTLALAASVFCCSQNSVCAAATVCTVEPWNIDVKIVCESCNFHYNLKENLPESNAQSSQRGFFWGCEGKKRLAKQLLGLGLPPESVWEYLLPNFGKILQNFQFVNVTKRDAAVTFDKEGFCYFAGVDGVKIDTERLFFDMLDCCGAPQTLSLPLLYSRAITVDELKAQTVKKASFTTYFLTSGENRSYNIALATQSLCGITVDAGQSFSFNEVVGPRTAQRGYRQSKVILDGNYADGIGGGVCQVSTTLYNALLLSEVEPDACQHSLVSSYVMAGFDAMVSDGGADLTFTNNSGSPLYIQGKVNEKSKCVTFTIYGKPNRYKVQRENEEVRQPFGVVEIVDAQKYPELVYTDQTKVIVTGSDGVKTKSYLCYYDGDLLVCRKLIRQNTYKKVDKIIARGDKIRPLDKVPAR